MKRPLPSWHGQIVGHAGGEGMADVKVRIAAVHLRIGNGAWRIELLRSAVGGGNIDGMG